MAGFAKVLLESDITAPTRTMILTAAGGAPSTTTGCSDPTKVETGATVKDYWTLDFALNEQAFWQFIMPDNWDGDSTAMTAIFYWTVATGTGNVTWGIKGCSLGNDDPLTQVYGTQRTSNSDAVTAAGDVMITSATSSSFWSASPSGGELVIVEVELTAESITGDARLLAVKLEYTTDTYSD